MDNAGTAQDFAPQRVPPIRTVRFRTLGCYPLSGAIESNADSVAAVVEEAIWLEDSMTRFVVGDDRGQSTLFPERLCA